VKRGRGQWCCACQTTKPNEDCSGGNDGVTCVGRVHRRADAQRGRRGRRRSRLQLPDPRTSTTRHHLARSSPCASANRHAVLDPRREDRIAGQRTQKRDEVVLICAHDRRLMVRAVSGVTDRSWMKHRNQHEPELRRTSHSGLRRSTRVDLDKNCTGISSPSETRRIARPDLPYLDEHGSRPASEYLYLQRLFVAQDDLLF